MTYPKYIDLHMHSTVSDGTDTPLEILERVQKEGIELFSLTDHDAIRGSKIILDHLKGCKESCPRFIPGVEFSCKDEDGKYHVLGYNYDPEAQAINDVVKKGHGYRIEKVKGRIEFLKKEFGFEFPQEEIEKLFELDNPGKPHIGNLMVKLGYAPTKEVAIKEYINKLRYGTQYVTPEEAIKGILASGGIPVLAHPSYADGEDFIVGDDMDRRLNKLKGFGLMGVEAFYSGFTTKLTEELLGFAEKYDFYVTAGSDYHGTNKLVVLGDTGCEDASQGPEALKRFLDLINP